MIFPIWEGPTPATCRPATALMESVDTKQKRPSERLADHNGEVLDLLAQFGATNIQVFGSVARGEDTVDSDLDILLDFPPEVGLFKQCGIVADLMDILGCDVDMVEHKEVPEKAKERVLGEARPL